MQTYWLRCFWRWPRTNPNSQKQAYELSVLTGTQVLLLVVSETGLVYTFTTPKLQPLVTKAEGKNLIQVSHAQCCTTSLIWRHTNSICAGLSERAGAQPGQRKWSR